MNKFEFMDQEVRKTHAKAKELLSSSHCLTSVARIYKDGNILTLPASPEMLGGITELLGQIKPTILILIMVGKDPKTYRDMVMSSGYLLCKPEEKVEARSVTMKTMFDFIESDKSFEFCEDEVEHVEFDPSFEGGFKTTPIIKLEPGSVH